MSKINKLVICSCLLIGVMGVISPLSARGSERASSNETYSGNRGDEGSRGASNEMYSGNRADSGQNVHSNEMYSGTATDKNADFYHRNEGYGAYGAGIEGVAAPYGSVPSVSTNPAQTESNVLYWGEVQQMEK